MVLRFNRATVCFVTCGSSHCNHKGCKIKVRCLVGPFGGLAHACQNTPLPWPLPISKIAYTLPRGRAQEKNCHNP